MNIRPSEGKPQPTETDPAVSRYSFRREMERLFDRLVSEFLNEWDGQRAEAIRVDVSESDEEIEVRAEVPGIDPKDLNIQLAGDVLVLSGERSDPVEPQRGARTCSERTFGSFRRALRLGAPVDADHVRAEHSNGVVTIRLTKSEAVRPRRIEIQSR